VTCRVVDKDRGGGGTASHKQKLGVGEADQNRLMSIHLGEETRRIVGNSHLSFVFELLQQTARPTLDPRLQRDFPLARILIAASGLAFVDVRTDR
jgi:hypothetical protein